MSVCGPDLVATWEVHLKIKRDLDQLLERWPGIVYDQFVVCPSCREKKVSDPGLFWMDWFTEVCPYIKLTCKHAKHKTSLSAKLVYPPRKGKVYF